MKANSSSTGKASITGISNRSSSRSDEAQVGCAAGAQGEAHLWSGLED
jgi:hypothetical protein